MEDAKAGVRQMPQARPAIRREVGAATIHPARGDSLYPTGRRIWDNRNAKAAAFGFVGRRLTSSGGLPPASATLTRFENALGANPWDRRSGLGQHSESSETTAAEQLAVVPSAKHYKTCGVSYFAIAPMEMTPHATQALRL